MPLNPDLRLIGFLCDHCAYAGADSTGRLGLSLPHSFKTVRLPCGGRLDPQWILLAFREGADGVLVGACHPGDCRYGEGNGNMRKALALLRRVLGQGGLPEARLKLACISAGEGERFAALVNEWAETLEGLRPRGIDP